MWILSKPAHPDILVTTVRELLEAIGKTSLAAVETPSARGVLLSERWESECHDRTDRQPSTAHILRFRNCYRCPTSPGLDFRRQGTVACRKDHLLGADRVGACVEVTAAGAGPRPFSLQVGLRNLSRSRKETRRRGHSQPRKRQRWCLCLHSGNAIGEPVRRYGSGRTMQPHSRANYTSRVLLN